MSLGLLALMGLSAVGSAGSPQALFITCRKCGRDPGRCMPNWDAVDLPDQGCVGPQGVPCAPNKGVQYTVRWNGASVVELPQVVSVYATGEVATYGVCYPGALVYTYFRACDPVFPPPVCMPGSFIAQANHGIARSALPQYCGASGLVPGSDTARYGMVLPYYAAVVCSDGEPVQWKQLQHICR
jgi:hypothetical protein